MLFEPEQHDLQCHPQVFRHTLKIQLKWLLWRLGRIPKRLEWGLQKKEFKTISYSLNHFFKIPINFFLHSIFCTVGHAGFPWIITTVSLWVAVTVTVTVVIIPVVETIGTTLFPRRWDDSCSCCCLRIPVYWLGLLCTKKVEKKVGQKLAKKLEHDHLFFILLKAQ